MRVLPPQHDIMKRLLLVLQLPALILAQNTTTAQNATTFALVYGYPLLAWQRYASALINDTGINALHHARDLSTPENRTVVKPNVDTLYSNLIYDLSESDLAVNLPDVPADSFKLFSLYDPYGVNWANVGTGSFFRNGSYLLHWNQAESAGLRVTNGSNYVAELSAPSPYGTLLIRWGVNDTNEDVVHDYQDSTTVEEVERSDDVFTLEMTPRHEELIDAYNASATPAENTLVLVARYEESNSALAGQFGAAGIADGTYEPQSSVNLTLANSTALAQAAQAATNPSSIVTLSNGWYATAPNLIGTYGTNYALRTAVANSGYLALRNPFAVYPNWRNGTAATDNFTVNPDEAVLFTFSGKPPLQQAGFWSLTAYDSDYFLIPNDISTYALGDRSNLTYPDGSPIYGPDADEEQNGTFQILMQAADVPPPENWTSNWLPTPAGGGAVVPQLRLFAAERVESNGTYEYPSVTRIAAVTEGESSDGGNATTSGETSSTSSAPSGTSGGESSSATASASANGGVSYSAPDWSGVMLFAVAVGSLLA